MTETEAVEAVRKAFGDVDELRADVERNAYGAPDTGEYDNPERSKVDFDL